MSYRLRFVLSYCMTRNCFNRGHDAFVGDAVAWWLARWTPDREVHARFRAILVN